MVTTYYCVIALLITAYVLGSIPSAVWIGKRYYGIDIREHGSKNAGATNMLRVLGRRAAIPVFIIDFLKGFAAVTIMSLLRFDESISPTWLINLKIAAVFAAVLGHIFPVFASFKGGKGVATLVGAIIGIQPSIALLCLVAWAIVFLAFHYVSLASIVAGCTYPVFIAICTRSTYCQHCETPVSFIIFAVIVAVILLWTHRKNIGRILDDSEPKLYICKRAK